MPAKLIRYSFYQSNNLSSDVSTLVDQGKALLSQGKYAQAIQRYDGALTIDELDYNILNSAVLGECCAHMGLDNYTEAIPYFDKALELHPDNKYGLNY